MAISSRKTRHDARVRSVRRRSLPRLEQLEARLVLSTFTVSNTDDSGAGSLRQAILDANNLNPDGAVDRIEFNIPGPGVQTIAPTSNLPTITDPLRLDSNPERRLP